MTQTLSPKENFRADTALKGLWTELVSKGWFRAGLSAALLEFSQNLPKISEGMEEAAMQHAALVGAREFTFILLNLAEEDQSRVPLDLRRQNLNLTSYAKKSSEPPKAK